MVCCLASQLVRLHDYSVSSGRLPGSCSLCPAMCQSLQPCTTLFIGWIFHNKSRINLLCWCASVYMVRHQNIWRERVLLSTLSGQPHLHSSKNNKLFVPRSLTASMGPRAFCSSGPTSWNTLPARLWHSSLTLEQFKCLLKASLFAWLSQHAP